MKNYLLISILILASYSIDAQSVPAFKAETIDNKSFNIPDDLKGKFSILCFAASQKAQADFESWLDPVYQKYIAKTGLMDDLYDINVYFIPVLTGINVSFSVSMKKKFKENVQNDLRSHVLFCNEEGKNLLSGLNMQKNDVPYFFVLNKDSKIIYRTSGKYTEEKFDAIDDLIE